MAANQKSEDFKVEDWAIPEDELPWNAPTVAPAGKLSRSRFQAPNIVDLDQYRRGRNPHSSIAGPGGKIDKIY